MSEKRLLYFLFNRYTGLVKVGITDNLEHRIRTLEHAGGVPLDVLGTLAESCDLEIPIHNALFATRKCGEWFLPTDDLLAIAKSPSRPAIMALLEKYAPAVKQRERELLVIDEAKREAREEQKRIQAAERKRLKAIEQEKERKAAERRAKKKEKDDARRHSEMEAFRAGSAEALEKLGLVLKNPETKPDAERQRERNQQLIGLSGGIS